MDEFEKVIDSLKMCNSAIEHAKRATGRTTKIVEDYDEGDVIVANNIHQCHWFREDNMTSFAATDLNELESGLKAHTFKNIYLDSTAVETIIQNELNNILKRYKYIIESNTRKK